MITASTIFLRALEQCGITHAFVNWGSDHPALLEEIGRMRSEGNGKSNFQIVTCPNEMVALSAAQGFAQTCGFPAAVLVHVDVGTQALAGAVHNADRSRVPVLIYAGASPFTSDGEMKGSRNEWIMWLQDIHDQSSIVRQYMRYTCQINSSKTIVQNVQRALQFATSDAKGPVYLWAKREVMEEELDEGFADSLMKRHPRKSVEPIALSPTATSTIAKAFVESHHPLIITSNLGRNKLAVIALTKLSEMLAIPVVVTCPSVVNMPHSHPHYVEFSFGFGKSNFIRNADTILIIDCDVPFIPVHNKPSPSSRIFHIDVDILKDNIGSFDLEAEIYCRADASLALSQVIDYAQRELSASNDSGVGQRIANRSEELRAHSQERISKLDAAESPSSLSSDTSITVPYLIGTLRKAIPLPEKTLFLNETISNYPLVWEHLRPEHPATVISSGASSLGWGLGAAVGACLAGGPGSSGASSDYDLIILVVGDGSFLFGVPSSAFWMARRYNTPFLTIVLNNGGWKSPKMSMLAVYPNGSGSKHSAEDLSVGFGPGAPDYAQIAAAAGGAWGKKISKPEEVEGVIKEAIDVVRNEKRCAVLDCVLEGI